MLQKSKSGFCKMKYADFSNIRRIVSCSCCSSCSFLGGNGLQHNFELSLTVGGDTLHNVLLTLVFAAFTSVMTLATKMNNTYLLYHPVSMRKLFPALVVRTVSQFARKLIMVVSRPSKSNGCSNGAWFSPLSVCFGQCQEFQWVIVTF
jgi:hypothetical protein